MSDKELELNYIREAIKPVVKSCKVWTTLNCFPILSIFSSPFHRFNEDLVRSPTLVNTIVRLYSQTELGVVTGYDVTFSAIVQFTFQG